MREERFPWRKPPSHILTRFLTTTLSQPPWRRPPKFHSRPPTLGPSDTHDFFSNFSTKDMGRQCMNINATFAKDGYDIPVFGIGHSCFTTIHVTAIVCLFIFWRFSVRRIHTLFSDGGLLVHRTRLAIHYKRIL